MGYLPIHGNLVQRAASEGCLGGKKNPLVRRTDCPRPRSARIFPRHGLRHGAMRPRVLAIAAVVGLPKAHLATTIHTLTR